MNYYDVRLTYYVANGDYVELNRKVTGVTLEEAVAKAVRESQDDYEVTNPWSVEATRLNA